MTTIETIDLARSLLNEPLDSARTFPDNSSNFYQDSVLLKYYNQTQQEIANVIVQAYENYFATSTDITIIANQDTYTLHSSVLKVTRMEWIKDDVTNPEEIKPISFNEKDDAISSITRTNSTTRAYAINGDSLILRPYPVNSEASAIRCHFIKKIPDSTAGSSVSEIPSTYHEALAWGIVKKALFQQEAGADSMAMASNEYSRIINKITEWCENRQIQMPRSVKRRKYRR